MQLEDRLRLRTALTAASCGLLGITSPLAIAAGSDATQVDSALLYYAGQRRKHYGNAYR